MDRLDTQTEKLREAIIPRNALEKSNHLEMGLRNQQRIKATKINKETKQITNIQHIYDIFKQKLQHE